MDDSCRRFFMEPEQTFHRRYEALRAFFVEGRSLEETAAKFGYRTAALKSMISRCYRWLASRLRGYEKAAPKQLYRRFVENAGNVEIHKDRIVVRFDKRSHNPILREAALDREPTPVPWLNNLPLVFDFS